MKKKVQVLLLSLIVAASLSSYIYLNISNLRYQGSEDPKKEQSLLQDLDASTDNTIMPDVRLLKKAADLGRKVLPGN